jgi:hypothetical protein
MGPLSVPFSHTIWPERGWSRVAPARLLLLLTLLLLPGSRARAQYTTAEISGVVKDAQGAVIPGAIVTATRVASGLKVERVSDAAGRFLLPGLPVGDYVLSVARDGFETFTERGIVLQVSQKVDLPVTLQVGQVTDAVTVTGKIPLLQTVNADIDDVIGNRQVVGLPLNGRQFVQLSLLSAGAVVPPGGTRGAALEQAGSLPGINGQRNGHNVYLVDGVSVTDQYFNNLAVSPSVEAIEEFRIDKTMYPAEFGGKSSALINVVTRSGSNQMHGSALEFLRNNRFDARNFFDAPGQPVPPLHRHQFGGSVGGPVELGPVYDGRDRTFFFFDYEGQRLQQSLTETFSVPSEALREGNFAGLPPIIDPLTGKPFPNNQIPSRRLDPAAIALLSHVAPPNTSGQVQNLNAVGNEVSPMDQFTLRVDHRAGLNDTLFGRFIAYDVTDHQPFGTSSLSETLVPGFGRVVTTSSRSLALSETHTFGSMVLNEARFGFLKVGGGQASPNAGVNFASANGLQGIAANGFPQVSFSGVYSTIGDPTTFASRQNTSYELYDNVMINRGAHQLKFGAYLFHLDFDPVLTNSAAGSFTYSGQFTGNALADFLLGYPGAGQVGIGLAAEQGRTTWLHLYGQDEWHAASTLTLDYGLRYEINGQMTDANNQLSAINFNVPGGEYVVASNAQGQISPAAQPLLSQIPIPSVTSQQAGWTPGLLQPSYLRFAPRLGVAWSATPRTVVRAGFGVFLNQWAYSVQQALAENLPFYFVKTVSVPGDATVPQYTTENVLLANNTGSIGGSDMDNAFHTEYAKNYTVSLQHRLASTTMVEVSYLGSRVTGADSSTILNVPQPGPGPIGPRRPVPQLGNISDIRWNGYSIYNGLTVQVARRSASGFSYSASYTLSKSIDDASDTGATVAESNVPQNVYDLAGERALSSFDHRHRFVGNAIYAFPEVTGGPEPLRAIGSGWRLNGIVTLQSGSPFTPILGIDRANIGAGPAQRPNISCDPNNWPATAAEWFNTACFSLPAPYAFGDSGRNTVIGPAYADVDAGLERDLQLPRGTRIQLRWEIFNLLNKTNFDTPNRIFGTSNFGRIFSAEPARAMQFGVKFLF